MSEVHAVTFNKRYYTKEKALKWLAKHNYNPTKIEDKKNILWFNLTPNNYKSYTTKPITKSIHLVLGWNDLSGEGLSDIWNSVKKVYNNAKDFLFNGIRKNAPPNVRNILKQHGSSQIVSLTVNRTPVFSTIQWIINMASFGKFEEMKNKLNYEDVYHLYLVVKLDNGLMYRIEKNQVVEFKVYQVEADTDFINIPLPHNITLSELIANGEMLQGSEYWIYDPITNNCQVFVWNTLKGNQLDSQEAYNFVVQDAEQLVDNEVLRKTGRTLTDLAARLDVLQSGSNIFKISHYYR